ncbi:MAG: ChaN family lipoprotein [Desulfuromonadales bacterium]|nr:ChaN family lipoprotein [Desulfuromonadales bacterium]
MKEGSLIRIVFVLMALTLPLVAVVSQLQAHPHIVEASQQVEISSATLLDDLRQVQVVFLGEFHNHNGHHQAQLSIIKALDNDERPLVLAVEMFRKENQHILDLWTDQQLSEREFLPVYKDNWSLWLPYRELFHYARDHKVKMLGLNVPREITRKVSRHGYKALSKEQRQLLGDVQCVVTPIYGDYIKQALGGHGGHGGDFLFFCEAQLLWDTLMARTLVDFLKENPDYRAVVMAGSGHAWKFGIPRQMLKQAEISYRVVLPEVGGRVDRTNLNREIADYLWLDIDEEGWTF